MTQETMPSFAFLTNHARALVCIARDPGIRLREIGERAGITERAAHRIVTELLAAGYVNRTRAGRRNRYTINTSLQIPDALALGRTVSDLLAVLAGA
jgi:DNA-binding MarR family transcriptional regulator